VALLAAPQSEGLLSPEIVMVLSSARAPFPPASMATKKNAAAWWNDIFVFISVPSLMRECFLEAFPNIAAYLL
jgi:hypothetical protein